METSHNKKRMKGVVVKNAMQKTVVVKVESFKMHPKYKKYVKSSKRFKAHDEQGSCKVGDTVVIEETRPLSRDKHFRIVAE